MSSQVKVTLDYKQNNNISVPRNIIIKLKNIREKNYLHLAERYSTME